MNAGGRGGSIEESLVSVEVVTAPPEVHVVTVAAVALNLAYRSSSLPAGSVIGRVELRLEEAEEPKSVSERVRELLAHRRETQPVSVLSVGSVFKNPAGDSAGRLIDECGLKGLREGDAVVSDIHANYVVNMGGATATQIRTLIEIIRDSVETLTGIRLELEVVPVGFEGDPAPVMAWVPSMNRVKGRRR